MSEQENSDTERPYQCDLCDDRFATLEEKKDHIWEYHEMDGDVPP